MIRPPLPVFLGGSRGLPLTVWLNITEVCVLTHEDATAVEQFPYLSLRARPLEVIEFWGRASKRSPPCPTDHCVFNWWQARPHPPLFLKTGGSKRRDEGRGFNIIPAEPDARGGYQQDVLLPFLMDPRFPDDLLAIVAEQDFRFFKGDCISGEHWYWVAEQVRQEEALERTGGARRLPEQDDPSHARQGKGRRTRQPAPREWGVWSAGGPTEENLEEPVSEEMEDLVRICTQASRAGQGLVWLSWNSHNKRPWTPSYGSHLIAIDKQTAPALHRKLGEYQPDHFDVVLREILITEPNFPGCFCWPAVGSFEAHRSGCDPHLQEDRQAPWDRNMCLEGVAPPRGKERWLAKIQRTGPPGWLVKLTFDCTLQENWLTRMPPDTWDDQDALWTFILRHRGWIRDGEWVGPEKGHAKGKGKKTGQRFCRFPEWRTLCEDPDGFEVNEHDEVSPITRLAAQVCCDIQDWDIFHPSITNRQWTMRKKNIFGYKWRVFAAPPYEARRGRTLSLQSCSSPFPCGRSPAHAVKTMIASARSLASHVHIRCFASASVLRRTRIGTNPSPTRRRRTWAWRRMQSLVANPTTWHSPGASWGTLRPHPGGAKEERKGSSS